MKKGSIVFVVVLMVLSCSLPCLAGTPLTLPAAIQKALKSNPSVQAYEKRLALAGLNIKIAKTAHWGELTGGATFDKSEDALIATPMTPQRMREGIQFDDTRWGFSLMYKLPIYLGGKIPLSIDISRLNEISTRLALKRLRAIIRHNVTELYDAILALDGEETAVKETLKALHSVLKHTGFSIAQGKTPPVDKYKINYSIQRWQAEADKITNQREALKIALQTLMGVQAVETDIFLEPIQLPDRVYPLVEGVKTLYTRALQARSDLAALENRVKITNKGVGLARAERLPSIFAVGAMQTYDGDDISGTEEWNVGLRLELPLFDAGRRRAQVEAAKVKVLEEHLHVFELRQKIVKEVGDAVKRVKTAEALAKSFLSRVSLGKEVDRVETLKYEKGAGDIDDMLRAKADLAYSNSQFVASLYQWLTARSYLNLVLEEEVK
ncbi:MAG: TolC family protein [Nitrospiraceae bacterium]|nr:TolC family protein [Nitrospiraceae bacterium]